jgi:hypothetical protein
VRDSPDKRGLSSAATHHGASAHAAFGRVAQAVLCGLSLAAIAGVSHSHAADSTKKPVTLREMIDAAMDETTIFVNSDLNAPAKPVVALRWANNSRGNGSEDGATVLFVHAGRPLAAACFYPWEGRLVHDFEAISRERVIGRRNGTIIWQPQTSGVKFADVPDAPAPDASRAQRLRQMKSLAEQFQSTMLGWKSDASDREELRLLPRPLYRYEPAEAPDGTIADGNAVDGAVFAFVMGTDPETLLLLEAVKKVDATTWQYAFARRTSGELDGRHRDQVVWKAESNATTNDPRQPHFSIVTLIPPELLTRGEAGGSQNAGRPPK